MFYNASPDLGPGLAACCCTNWWWWWWRFHPSSNSSWSMSWNHTVTQLLIIQVKSKSLGSDNQWQPKKQRPEFFKAELIEPIKEFLCYGHIPRVHNQSQIPKLNAVCSKAQSDKVANPHCKNVRSAKIKCSSSLRNTPSKQ